MPVNEHVLTVVRGWIEKAESDLKIAVIALKAGKDCPADAVAFPRPSVRGKIPEGISRLVGHRFS